MIPRVAHVIFGLEQQREPFHFLHFVSIESCRRVLEPDAIYFHHKHLPWGPWWERIRPHLTLVPVDLVEEVLEADYSAGQVPDAYRYAHHADAIRLDALIERGGVYADIDTIFVRTFPDELFEAPFVIGREPSVMDEKTGESRPSLCNALLMAEPGARFAVAWRDRMPAALDGSWSNHSGFLSDELSRVMPSALRIEPEESFFPFPFSRDGLAGLLEERQTVPATALSVHLWAHLWWDRRRRDFSRAHSGWYEPAFIRGARTTLADLARPYLPRRHRNSPGRWSYMSLDESSGYGVAADRCMAALEQSGLEVEWTPFGVGRGWDLGYEPALALETSSDVAVVHLPPEFIPLVRERSQSAYLVGHTVWETDRLPSHWIPCLDSADLLIVPSQFAAAAIEASPVVTPVSVVPHVAPEINAGTPGAWSWIPEDTFIFYTIAQWTERKAVFSTIEAYLRAFTGRDQVLLIVKTSDRDYAARPAVGGKTAQRGTTAWSVAHLIAAHADPPPVRLITRVLTDGEISGLHHRGDCFVSLCRSEGWGLGAFDAATHGNPVVTTGFGGHLDYLADSPYLVDYDLVPVIDRRGFPSYAPDQRWGEPDLDHAAAVLRKVVEHPEQAVSSAASIATEIRQRYRPAAIAAEFRAAVERHRSTGARHGTATAAARLQ